jgi:hypothetical protein
MTVAAIDVRRAVRPLDGPLVRLTVHHATIFEMNVESYRRRTAYAAAKPLGDTDEGSQRDTEKPDNEETATALSDIET